VDTIVVDGYHGSGYIPWWRIDTIVVDRYSCLLSVNYLGLRADSILQGGKEHLLQAFRVPDAVFPHDCKYMDCNIIELEGIY
jgi:hypothetical protein